MRLAYVVSFAFPNASAGTRRVIGICQALVHAGVDVTVYSAAGGCEFLSNLNGLPDEVQVIYTSDRKDNSLLRNRLLSAVFFGGKTSKLLHKNLNNFDTILLYSGYTPMLLRLLKLRNRFKKKVFFHLNTI